nr:uncharacterized protein LOC106826881 isoform X2 [Equus asinus]
MKRIRLESLQMFILLVLVMCPSETRHRPAFLWFPDSILLLISASGCLTAFLGADCLKEAQVLAGSSVLYTLQVQALLWEGLRLSSWSVVGRHVCGILGFPETLNGTRRRV